MPRTNDTLVRGVVEVEAGDDLTPFIAFANELVTECCTESGYSDYRLQMIETWLAGHLYNARNKQTTQESVGGVSVQYGNKVDLGFRYTFQGQQVLRLDTQGNLAALDNAVNKVTKTLTGGKKKVSLRWLGDEDAECD